MKADTLNEAVITVGISHYATTKPSHVSNCAEGRLELFPHEQVLYYLDSLLVEKEDKKIVMVLIDVIYVKKQNPKRHQVPLEKVTLSEAQLLELKEYYPEAYKYLKRTKLSAKTAVIKELE